MPFVAYPSAFFFAKPEEARNSSSVQHYPWGFFVSTTGIKENGFLQVKVRFKDKSGTSHPHSWIHEEDVQPNRLLEVNFVDIGQGDGCFLVFPDDRRMLIDAGQFDNMYRFLRWRFNRKKTHIHNVVITHPDQDHYLGFGHVIGDEKFSFGNVYHNGIVERSGKDTLGARTTGRGSELTDVIETPEQLDDILDKPSKVGNKKYPKLLKKIRGSGRSDAIWMLHVEDRFMPGYEADRPVSMEVLGPYPTRAANDRLRLRWFGSKGKTKNGHSVVLRLTCGKVSVLLGGDLNIRAENHLLSKHTGLDPTPESLRNTNSLFAARVASSCVT